VICAIWGNPAAYLTANRRNFTLGCVLRLVGIGQHLGQHVVAADATTWANSRPWPTPWEARFGKSSLEAVFRGIRQLPAEQASTRRINHLRLGPRPCCLPRTPGPQAAYPPPHRSPSTGGELIEVKTKPYPGPGPKA